MSDTRSKSIWPPDATKLLLDRIISWEKDLSEYPSLESILREQFLICERVKTVENMDDIELPYNENDPESVNEYLRSQGCNPEELGRQGIVFVKTVMDKIRLEKFNTQLIESLKEMVKEFNLSDNSKQLTARIKAKVILESIRNNTIEKL